MGMKPPLCYPCPTSSFRQPVLPLFCLFSCHHFPPGTPFPAGTALDQLLGTGGRDAG